MRVAIVHHWFVTRGGGERVAECIASFFPDAENLYAGSRFVCHGDVPAGLRADVSCTLLFCNGSPLPSSITAT